MSRILLPVIAASRRRSVWLYQEDWEGTGLPAGWTFNGTGTCNPDNTSPASPAGGHNLLCAGNTNQNVGGGQFTLPAPFPLGTFGMYFQFRGGNLSTALNRTIWICNAFTIVLASGAQTSSFGALSPTLSANTWYHVWIDRTPTTGAVYFSTTATKPGSPHASAAGSYPDLSKFTVCFNRAEGVYVDKIRIASGPIGSDPI